MTELLELLGALKSNAQREREALRALDSRALLELAAAADGLARRLGAAMGRLNADERTGPSWSAARAQSAELKLLLKANATIATRCLGVVRSLQRSTPPPADAPAFVSRHA